MLKNWLGPLLHLVGICTSLYIHRNSYSAQGVRAQEDKWLHICDWRFEVHHAKCDKTSDSCMLYWLCDGTDGHWTRSDDQRHFTEVRFTPKNCSWDWLASRCIHSLWSNYLHACLRLNQTRLQLRLQLDDNHRHLFGDVVPGLYQSKIWWKATVHCAGYGDFCSFNSLQLGISHHYGHRTKALPRWSYLWILKLLLTKI